jgi:hypothetical protein
MSNESMHGFYPSAAKQRIDMQCARYLHKPTGKRFYIAYTAAMMSELHEANELRGISGSVKYASDEQLANAEIWERLQ